MKDTKLDRRVLLLYYLLAFVLLWEWLKPVMVLTDTGGLWLFLTFIALSFFLGLFSLHWVIIFPLKIMYIFFALHYAYMGSFLPTPQTMSPIIHNLLSNIGVFVRYEWGSITDPMRTVLFFTLLWMTTYLIRYWIEVRQNMLLFYAMTILFITIIDTFSAYSAEGSIFIVLAAGLLLLGLMTVSRIAGKKQQPMPIAVLATMVLPLLFVMMAGGVLSSALPKPAPQWPDPVPFLTAKGKTIADGGIGRGSGSSAKSGYDVDDSELGGSFIQDDTVVFEAVVPQKQYWKIETKNTYTSKGWEQVYGDSQQTIYQAGEALRPINDQESLTAQLTMELSYPFLMYPYGLSAAEGDGVTELIYSDADGKYHTQMNGNEFSPASYIMRFQEPTYSLRALRDISIDELANLDRNEFLQYLQLPGQLPERVIDLAKEITAEERSVYDMAKAIERYFGRSGFVYDTQNVAKPDEGEDYVDQFLFDTKRGYCDNFSTSMVVMLRSVGIPARWVKGFAPGEEAKNDNGEKVYRVTNAEAHSWVEAYMPGIGWMPFEPTIGFTSTTDVTYDLDLDRTPTDTNGPEEVKKPDQPDREKKPTASKKMPFFNWEEIMKWSKSNMWGIVLVVLLVGGAAGWGYAKRSRWIPKILMWRNKEMSNWNDFQDQYHLLLRQLERCGIKRPTGMTLLDYAVIVDEHFKGDQMLQLTIAYEQGIYGKDKENHEWVHLQEMWKDLINRTAG